MQICSCSPLPKPGQPGGTENNHNLWHMMQLQQQVSCLVPATT
jgi:hypothetical protein